MAIFSKGAEINATPLIFIAVFLIYYTINMVKSIPYVVGKSGPISDSKEWFSWKFMVGTGIILCVLGIINIVMDYSDIVMDYSDNDRYWWAALFFISGSAFIHYGVAVRTIFNRLNRN